MTVPHILRPLDSPYDVVRLGPGQHLHPLHRSKHRVLILAWRRDKRGEFRELPGLGLFNSTDECHAYLEKRLAVDQGFRRRYAGGWFLPVEVSGAMKVDAGYGT